MTPIPLAALLGDLRPHEFKLHLGKRSSDTGDHPLDLYLQDRNLWMDWHRWRGNRDDWTRPRIFSLIQMKDDPSTFLFGGVFKVIAKHRQAYEIAREDLYSEWEGRLVVRLHKRQGLRGRAFNFERLVDLITVEKVLVSPLDFPPFPGFYAFRMTFADLRAIWRANRTDWSAPLGTVSGIYHILDRETGKSYVGSAHGQGGLWQRWSSYFATGHGSNVAMRELLQEMGTEYSDQSFQMSILETLPTTLDVEAVIQRESHWKEVLGTRHHGLNRN